MHKQKGMKSRSLRLKILIEIFSLVALISASLILVVLFYSGPFVLFDDSVYTLYAHQMLTGTFNPLNGAPFSIKFITIGIWALSIKLLGYNMFAVELPSLIALIAMIVLTYLIGKELWGYEVGILSSAFVALSPVTVSYATRMLPDLIVGSFCALLIYLIILTKRSNHRSFI